MTDTLRRFITSWPLWIQLIVAAFVTVPFAHLFGSLLSRLFMLLLGVQFQRRTDKAKEKLADSLMSMSTTLLNGVFLGVLVFPLTAFIQSFVSGKDPVPALQTWLSSLTWTHVGLFGGFFIIPAVVANLARTSALTIYDAIARKSWP
jgi:hypothetical protein